MEAAQLSNGGGISSATVGSMAAGRQGGSRGDGRAVAAAARQQRRQLKGSSGSTAGRDVSRLERYCTNVLLAHLTKVRR
jgi:hypothetical protein